MTSAEVDVNLSIRTESDEYRGECPVLVGLLPPATYGMMTARRWECGLNTFEILIKALLEPLVDDDSQHEGFAQKLRDGMWDLVYREAPIQPSKFAPEGRLWPA